jgi:ADP-dependent phosphofructokinase/glucokinase
MLKFIKNLIEKIKVLFGALPAELKVAIALGATIVENIKKVIDSPVVDVLTAIIPGGTDDAIVAAIRAALPNILQSLHLADAEMDANDPEAIIQTAIQCLSEVTDGDVKNAILHSLSIMLAQVAADGKLTWSDGVYLLEWYYQNKVKAA